MNKLIFLLVFIFSINLGFSNSPERIPETIGDFFYYDLNNQGKSLFYKEGLINEYNSLLSLSYYNQSTTGNINTKWLLTTSCNLNFNSDVLVVDNWNIDGNGAFGIYSLNNYNAIQTLKTAGKFDILKTNLWMNTSICDTSNCFYVLLDYDGIEKSELERMGKEKGFESGEFTATAVYLVPTLLRGNDSSSERDYAGQSGLLDVCRQW